MKMTDAMKQCKPGGFVSRKAYPNIMFFKNGAGIFPESYLVSRLDYLSTDWQHHAPPDAIAVRREGLSYNQLKKKEQPYA